MQNRLHFSYFCLKVYIPNLNWEIYEESLIKINLTSFYFLKQIYFFNFKNEQDYFTLHCYLTCQFPVRKFNELFLTFLDINECSQNPCGVNTICTDTVGSFVCSCKEDYSGDPFKGCVGAYRIILVLIQDYLPPSKNPNVKMNLPNIKCFDMNMSSSGSFTRNK